MEQHVSNAQDVNGNALRGATITVLDSLGFPASIFEDNGVTPKANPFLSDASGEFAFYAADGKYTVTIAAVGYTTETRAGITLLDPSAPLFPADLTVAGNLQVNGNTTLGNQPADSLTVSSNAVLWPGNPDHSGNHTFSGNVATRGSLTIGNEPSDPVTVHSNAVTWVNGATHSGNHVFSGDLNVSGNTMIGDAAGDVLTVNPSTVNWPNNPTHSGTHTFNGGVTVQGLATMNGNTSIGNAPTDTLSVAPNAVTWTGNPTHSGNHVFSGNLSVGGNTVVGDAAGDTLTVNPSSVSWPNNPTHSGNHTFSTGVRVGNTAQAGVTVLDHYEEGTFTPELRFGGSNTGITYGSRTGVFTRIGNRVDCYIDFTLTSKGAQVGNATVSGLYVGGLTVLNGGAVVGVSSVMTGLTGGLVAPASTVDGGSFLFLQTSATGTSAATNTNFNNTSRIQMTGTYWLT